MADVVFNKISDTEISSTETKTVEAVHSIPGLIGTKKMLEKEIAYKQKQLDEINALLGEAEKLGISIKTVTPVTEVIK